MSKIAMSRAVVGAIVLVLGAMTLVQRYALVTATEQRDAERLAATAAALAASDPRAAADLALAAAGRHPSAAAQAAMSTIASQNQIVKRSWNEGDPIQAVAAAKGTIYSAHGSTVSATPEATGQGIGSINVGESIDAMAPSPDGSTIALAASTHLIMLTNDHGRMRKYHSIAFASGFEQVAVGLSPDVRQVFALSDGGVLDRWATATGKSLSETDIRPTPGTTITGDSDGRYSLVGTAPDAAHSANWSILAATSTGQVLRIDISTGTASQIGMTSRRSSDSKIVALAEGDDGGLAIGTSDGQVSIRAADGERLPNEGLPASPYTLSWAHGGRYVMAGTRDGVFTMSVNGQQQNASPHLDYRGSAQVLAPAGEYVVAGMYNGQVAMLDPASNLLGTLLQQSSSTAAVWAPDGHLVVDDTEGLTTNHVFKLYSVDPRRPDSAGSYKPVRTYSPDNSWWSPGRSFYVNDVAVDTDLVAAVGLDPDNKGFIGVWNGKSGKPVRRLEFSEGQSSNVAPYDIVTQVLLLPGRNELVAYSAALEQIGIWSTKTWKQTGTVQVGSIGGLVADPSNGTLLAAPADDRHGILRIDLSERKVSALTSAGKYYRVEVTNDGDTIAASSMDQHEVVFLDKTGHTTGRTAIAGLPVELAWSKDSRVLAVSTWDQGVVLVDRSGHQAGQLNDPALSETVDLSWNTHGQLATTGSHRNRAGQFADPVAIWNAEPDWTTTMCRIIGTPLSRAEWASYVDNVGYRHVC